MPKDSPTGDASNLSEEGDGLTSSTGPSPMSLTTNGLSSIFTRVRRSHRPLLEDNETTSSASVAEGTRIRRIGAMASVSGEAAEAARVQAQILAMLLEAQSPMNAEGILEGLYGKWYSDEEEQLAARNERAGRRHRPTPTFSIQLDLGQKRLRNGKHIEQPSMVAASIEYPDPSKFTVTESDVLEHLATLRKKGRIRPFIGNSFHFASSISRSTIVTNLLVSKDYQAMGLEARVISGSAFHIIPPEAEHRFLCFRRSTIPGAQLGLFLMPFRMIRAGTIICEYRGRMKKRNDDQSSHAVRLQSGLVLDGIDAEGNVMSLAPLMNDNGPAESNVKLTEFDEMPERVFVAAKRDLFGGEELFVEYGANYWGKKTYAEVNVRKKKLENDRSPHSTRAAVSSAGPLVTSSALLHPYRDEVCTKCRACSSLIPRRVFSLHNVACNDPLTLSVPCEIDPLPINHFTSTTHNSSFSQKNIQKQNIGPLTDIRTSVPQNFASFFVHSNPLTFSLTHEIVNPTEVSLDVEE